MNAIRTIDMILCVTNLCGIAKYYFINLLVTVKEMRRHGIGQRTKKRKTYFGLKNPLLLIKASGQSNFKQHLSLFFHHPCILHSYLF